MGPWESVRANPPGGGAENGGGGGRPIGIAWRGRWSRELDRKVVGGGRGGVQHAAWAVRRPGEGGVVAV
ncbi:MAG: hypothetical protein K0R41_2323 [Geminicoccaceae bacterium]|jgi:hypothetical protein|nr:hypothetical protein [Geminicoccaceae bacterium]